MISTLIAKAGGIRVETLVGSQPIQVKEAEGTASPKPTVEGTKSDEGVESEDITGLIHGIFEATHLRNWELAEQRYEAGLKRIREKEPHQEMFWKSFYQWVRLSEGMPDVLAELRNLVAQTPDDNRPLRYLAFCLVDLHEYEEAVDCYLRAAAIAKPIGQAALEIDAAETLQRAKKPSQAKQIMLGLLNSEPAIDAKTKFSVLRQLYSLYKESEDKLLASRSRNWPFINGQKKRVSDSRLPGTTVTPTRTACPFTTTKSFATKTERTQVP